MLDDDIPSQAATSIEEFTSLDNPLLDTTQWGLDHADLFTNPHLQHVHRRSISEPPKSAETEQHVVFHRELHASRKPKTAHRTQPYSRDSKKSPRLVSLSENRQPSTWHHLQSPQGYALPDNECSAIDPQLQGQTLSLTGKRTIEPVLRITMQELREIIATTVLRTVHECQLMHRTL